MSSPTQHSVPVDTAMWEVRKTTAQAWSSDALQTEVMATYSAVFRDIIGRSGSSHAGRVVLDGKEAHPALQHGATRLEAEIQSIVSKYPSHAWLRFLRDLPAEVFGEPYYHMPGSSWERRIRAEGMSHRHAAPPNTHWDQTLPLEDVVEFSIRSKVLRNLVILQRLASKEVPIVFQDGREPVPLEDDPRCRAVRIQDCRLDGADMLHLTTGTLGTYGSRDEVEAFEVIVGLQYRPWTPLRDSRQYSLRLSDGRAMFDWSFLPATSTTRSLPLRKVMGLPSDALFSDLLVHRYLYRRLIESGDQAVEALRFGYLQKLLAELQDDLMIGLSSPQVLRLAETIGLAQLPSVNEIVSWVSTALPDTALSPVGPVVRPVGDDQTVLLDLAASTNRVHQRLSLHVDGGGAAVNVRGRDFERQVQALIDQSPWRPPEELRQFVGRKLRPRSRGDEQLTDLDGLAVKDGVAILIDAKSLASPGAIRGDWGATKNVRERLVADWRKWRSHIELVAREPIGHNYDFSIVTNLVPLIVTTGPHYVHENLLEPRVLGSLRPVSSLRELLDFLGVPVD